MNEIRSQHEEMEPPLPTTIQVPIGYYHQLVAFYEKYRKYVSVLETQDQPPPPTSPGAEDVRPSHPSIDELLKYSKYRETPVPDSAIPRGSAARKMSEEKASPSGLETEA
jgi:hypothetical protein